MYDVVDRDVWLPDDEYAPCMLLPWIWLAAALLCDAKGLSTFVGKLRERQTYA